jgi:hypothetical protein
MKEVCRDKNLIGPKIESNSIWCPTCRVRLSHVSGPTQIPKKKHEIIVQECFGCGMELEITFYPEFSAFKREIGRA